MSTEFIALDWGTTSFRAYRVGAGGHVLDTIAAPEGILAVKFDRLGRLALADPAPVVDRLNGIESLSADELKTLYDFSIKAS